MGKYRLLTLTLAMGLSFGSVNAATYEHYLDQLANHPSVTQIREQSLSLKSLASSADSLPDPQIVLGVDNLPVSDPEFDRFLPSSKVIGFRQAIPNPAMRANKEQLQQQKSVQLQLMADYQLSRIRANFTKQLIQNEKVSALERLLKEQLDLYQLIETDLQGQLEAGKPVYGRFSEIDVERSSVEQNLNDLRAERINIEETLIELVDSVPSIPAPEIAIMPWSRTKTTLYPVAIKQEGITISEHKIDIAESGFKPSYGLQALYKQRESSKNFSGDDWFSIQASISIPLWSKSNQTPKVNSAKAAKRSSQDAYEQSKRRWNQKMASLRAEQQYTQENIQLLKKKKAALTEMIAAAQRNYESGNTTLESVVDAQINHLSIAARLVSQQSRYKTLAIEFNSHIKDDNIMGDSDATQQ